MIFLLVHPNLYQGTVEVINSMSDIQIRPCTPKDAEAAVPLIYSSGPKAYDLAFSDKAATQSLDFLHHAFITPGTEFSFDQHTALIKSGKLVAVGGVKTKSQTLKFTINAAKLIFSFYSLTGACRTIVRGLKIESVLKPPKAQVAMIHNLAVSESVRSQGLGRVLIAELEQQMLKAGYQIAALDVDSHNPKAQALYEKLSYQVKSTHSGDVKGRFDSALPMKSFYMEKNLLNQ